MAGAVSGAALGGVAGSTIGRGRARWLAPSAERCWADWPVRRSAEKCDPAAGLEITVQLDNGRMVAVTQAADEPFYPGDRVRVLIGSDGTTRVAHY